MRKGKAPIYKLSHSKAPKTQQNCQYRHTTKNQWIILLYDTGVGFISRNYFAYLVSFAQVFFSVEAIIPWANQGTIDSTGTQQIILSYDCNGNISWRIVYPYLK